MPPAIRFAPDAPRPKDIDLIIPGLGTGSGRNRDRFRVSSETRARRAYLERQMMVRDLGNRLMFSVLRARLEGRFTTAALHAAYREGQSGLDRLLESATTHLLDPLVSKYIVVLTARDKAKTEKQLRRFIEWCGGVRVAHTGDLTTPRIAEFLRSLTSRRGKRGGPVSGATQNRYRAALGGFCSYLVREEVIDRHPVALHALPRADEGEHRLPELSPAEYHAYFAEVARLNPELVPVYRLLIHTGADLGEVLTRTVRDLDFDRAQPRVRYRRTKTRTPERRVPLPIEFVPELRGHVAGHGLRPADALFGLVNRWTVIWVHKQARKSIGRPDLRLKDFRHIAAIMWRKGGVEIELVREWLGHSSISQTVIYNSFAPDDDHDAPKVARATQLLIADGGSSALRVAS